MGLKKFKYTLLFCLISIPLTSQYYITGQNPFSVKWKQIQTEHFQIIYPEGFDSLGNETANKMMHLYDSVSASLNHKPRKISIILQTAQSYSNGYVSWAPKRSEFYLTYPQEYSNADWLELLAVHEFRHVVQIDKYNQGITKVLSTLFGEQGIGAILGVTTPSWVFEGDATWTESKFTDLGRGFRGDFVSSYAAYREGFSSSSYGKSSFGSYNHNVPDLYAQGYHYINYIRKNFGDSAVSNIIDKVARNPIRYKPFSRVMKKEIGFTTRQLHNKYFEETTNKKLEVSNKEVFKSYSSPLPVNDSLCIALREGYDKVTQIIHYNFKNKQEKKLCNVGWMSHSKLGYGDSVVYWTENLPDIRWGNNGSSDIYKYDIRNHKKSRLTKGNRYYAVQSKPNGQILVAVQLDDSLQASVVFLNAVTGVVQNRFQDGGAQYRTPSFVNNTNRVLAIKSKEGHNYLVEIEMDNGVEETLFDFGNKYVLNPVYAQGNVYVEAGLVGSADQVFCLNLKTKELTQVSSTRYGTSQPMFYEGKIMVSDRGSNGNEILILESEGRSFEEGMTFEFSSTKQLEWKNYTPTNYTSKKYRKLPHLLNFHSWEPLYFGPDEDDGEGIAIGVGFKSQNKLSTAITKIHYGYQPIKKEQLIEGTFTYLGFFPEIEYKFDLLKSGISTPQELLFHEVAINLPMNLSRSANQRKVEIGVELGNAVLLSEKRSSSWTSGINLSAYNIGNKAVRDVGYSKYQLLSFMLKNDLETGELRMLQAVGEVHFPSIFKHHNFRLETGFIVEKSVFKESYYGSYETTIYDVAAFQSNYDLFFVTYGYEFPILCPDWDLNLVYIKRLKARVFLQTYPYSNITTLEGQKFLGLDLRSDAGFIHFNIDVGVRTRVDLQTNTPRFEVLFDYSI